jgi:hypothetical protein
MSFTRKELLEMKRMGIDPNTVEIMQEGGETEGGDQQAQVMQLIQVYAQLSQTTPEEIMGSLEEMEPEAQSQALQQMSEQVQQAMGDQNQMMQKGGERGPYTFKDGVARGWKSLQGDMDYISSLFTNRGNVNTSKFDKYRVNNMNYNLVPPKNQPVVKQPVVKELFSNETNIKRPISKPVNNVSNNRNNVSTVNKKPISLPNVSVTGNRLLSNKLKQSGSYEELPLYNEVDLERNEAMIEPYKLGLARAVQAGDRKAAEEIQNTINGFYSKNEGGDLPVMQMGGMSPQDQQMMQQQMMQQSQQPQGSGEEEQIMQILQAYAQMNQMDEQAFQELVKTFEEASPEQQQQMLQEMVAEIEQAQGGQNPEQMEDPNAQGPEEQMEQNPMMESGGYLSHARQWLQKGGSTNFFQEKYEDPNNPNVNVENREVLHTPQGEAFKVHGNTHAEGGIDMNLEEGTKVFSQHIKAPSEIAKRFVKNAKTKMSFADLAGKFTTDKDLKIMNDPNSDKYAKATAAINFERKQEMLNQVFTAQEMFKKAAGLDQIEYTDSNSKKKV